MSVALLASLSPPTCAFRRMPVAAQTSSLSAAAVMVSGVLIPPFATEVEGRVC
jgi:hypothetical protein